MNLSIRTSCCTLLVTLACAGLLTACGGDGKKLSPPKASTAYSSYASMEASSIAPSSTPASSVAPSSIAPSSTPVSSAPESSAPASSSLASSSVAALVPPVVLVDTQINGADGDYLVASGDVLVGMPEGGGNTSFSGQLLNRSGFTLYTFANDTPGVSVCSGNCLVNWPPLLANPSDQASAPYSIIERSMGTAANALQWAYHGKPLYFFKGDTTAGLTAGKAIPNWPLARPLPIQIVADATLGSHLAAAGMVKLATPVSGVEQTSIAERSGFTLYTFDNDSAGVSNCAGNCLTNWPALIAHAGAVASAPYSLVMRASGEMQWALNGMPLYFFAGDTQAGQTNGEAIGNNWFVARTAPVAVSNHPTKNRLLVAHGNIVNADGVADNSHLDFTLYTFDDDTPGVTTCFGGCLVVWPALYAPADAQAFGDFTVIARDATTKQWAYKGLPLYFYVGDTAPGNVTGEYTDWTIARP
jgi:predicted lipoprotein with Yx(FWY)xxD motif